MFLDFLTRRRKANEAVVTAIQNNSLQLEAVVQALTARESPETIRSAVCAGLKDGGLENALMLTGDHVAALNSSLQKSGSRPIPVQTFPILDDFEFEEEKQVAAAKSVRAFGDIGKGFIEKFARADKPVDQAMTNFFSMVEAHVKSPRADNESLKRAMADFLECSPKNVIAAFQKEALEAGLVLVQQFNQLIDMLAKEYPRCRAGIFASRLNYSDAIQISEEIIATLRTTSTMLDEVQRRHDLLEALQGELVSDLQSSEIELIWDAIGASFKDTLKLGNENDGFFTSLLKKAVAPTLALSSFAMAIVSLPTAQFQGQLARAHRIKVFIATTFLLKLGWEKWSKSNEEIVIPNLRVMFALKGDFVHNRLLSISDLISHNGYSLDGLTTKVDSVLKTKKRS